MNEKLQVKMYLTDSGKVPFEEWFKKLDGKAKARIQIYIERLSKRGTLNQIKPLGDGVFEMKIHFGPGYRVYFTQMNSQIILLLLGGDKKSQKHDIEKAKNYWRGYAQTIR